jgi:hypothetical protein
MERECEGVDLSTRCSPTSTDCNWSPDIPAAAFNELSPYFDLGQIKATGTER